MKEEYKEAEFKVANKVIRKQLGKDKRKYVLETMNKDLDIRDRWMGIRNLKNGYKPRPYYRKDMNGNPVTFEKQAEAAAEYLEQKQWGKTHITENAATTHPNNHREPLQQPPQLNRAKQFTANNVETYHKRKV